MARDRPMVKGVVLPDSQVAGYWKRTPRKGSVVIEATLHTSFDGAKMSALHAAADGYGAVLGLAATVVTTAVPDRTFGVRL